MEARLADPRGYKKFEAQGKISPDFLSAYIDNLMQFLDLPSTGDNMYEMADEIGQEIAVEFKPRQIILSGYPTYVLDIADKNQRKVPEYTRYYSEKKAKTTSMEGNMPCPSCIKQNELNSFFPFCNSCQAPFKVRDMIELFPDIDMILTVDQYDPNVFAHRLENFRKKRGYSSSYDDYEHSLQQASEFINACNKGNWDKEKAKKAIKLDMIAIPANELLEGYKQIGMGNLNTKVPLYIHRNNQMVLYPDNLGTELFISRHIPPIYADPVGYELYQQMEFETAKYVHEAGNTSAEVTAKYLANLQAEYPKNFNIISSSPSLLGALENRISKYF